MTLRLLLTILLVGTAANACGGAKSSGAEPAAAPDAAAPDAATSTANEPAEERSEADLAAAFERAERELAGLGLADARSGETLETEANKKQAAAGRQPADDAAPTTGKSVAAPHADRCVVACRALASMRRAADGLCSLSGADDPRCESVKERAERARKSVQQACPSCAAARSPVDPGAAE